MIYWTAEGHTKKIGLNVYANKKYIRFIWEWFNTATNDRTSYYVRFRFFQKPRFIFEKRTWNLIEHWLLKNDKIDLHFSTRESLAAEAHFGALAGKYNWLFWKKHLKL